MAFVHRAKRGTSQPIANGTSSALGPGSYEATPSALSPNRLRLSYAPFASSAERGMDAAAVGVMGVTPGPGEYTSSVPGASRAPAVSHSFVSAVPRFGMALDPALAVPGPGAYVALDVASWHSTRGPARRRDGVPGARKGGVEWQRVAGAPSIPAPTQSFGYEENSRGELVLQTPASLPGHTGRGVDQVGPGEYLSEAHENLLANARKKGFAEWSKTRTHRDGREDMLRKAATLPGPGSYASGEEEPRRRGKKISPFFASKVSRLRSAGPAIGRDAVPGPGSYGQGSSFDRIASNFVPSQYQFFGSKTDRVVGGILGQVEATPGPGTYSSKSSIKQAGAADPYAPHLAFKSTSQRFTGDPSRDVPGPGSYAELSNTSAELSKKVFGRNTSFGTTEQRFHIAPRKSNAANADLGPTSYSPRHTGAIRLARKPHSVFVSTTKRFDAARGKDAYEEKQAIERANQGYASAMEAPPAIGGMGAEPIWGNHSKANAQSSAFAAKQSRFDKKPNTQTSSSLGPGAYATANASNLYRSSPAIGSSFKNSERSAAGLGGVYRKDNGPGPGSYTKDVTHPRNSTFITPSFNITIATDL